MHGSTKTTRFQFWLWLIRLIGIVVPRRLRADWKQEWEAELHNRETLLAEWDRLDWRNKLDLFRRSSSAFWDALWLQTYRWEDAVIQDLRFGVRMLLKHKGFTMVAVLSLALGIGANTAIFHLIDVVRLRTLPVNEPHQLAEVHLADMKGARGGLWRPNTVTYPIWEKIRERQEALSGIFAWGTRSANLSAGGEVRSAQVLFVSGDFFKTLGVRPALGRLFTATDDQRGCGESGLVISHDFWQREYGGDPNIIGRVQTVGEHDFEIIGVTPSGFFGMEVGRTFDVAVPICATELVRHNNWQFGGTIWWLTVNGRMKPGWSLEKATEQLQSISAGAFEETLPPNYPAVSVTDYLESRLVAVPAESGVSQLRDKYEQSLWLLLAIACSVLLVACANLANLLLARGSARQREIAVRQALGASRGRLVRQLLLESLLLAILGAGFGVVLAQSLSRFLVAFLSTGGDSIFLNLSVDWRVLAFTAALACLTCLLFGLAPAIRATRMELVSVMKSGGHGTTAGTNRFGLWRVLLVSQVAISLVLVCGALLFTRSLRNLMTVNTGFRQEGILLANVGLGGVTLPRDRFPALENEVLDRVKAIPGVESTAFSHSIPILGRGNPHVWMDGVDLQQGTRTYHSRVGPNYFNTMEIPVLSGRDFDGRDLFDTPLVGIVNEAFVRKFLNGADPIGHRFWIEGVGGEPNLRYEIVGVVRDTKYGDLREAFAPIAYVATTQAASSGPGGWLVIRSRVAAAETFAQIKRILGEINPAITVSFREYKPMIEATILRERLMATLSGFFGVLALLLASIGLYGMLSYSVARRTNEIGIRMAIGAQGRDVLWLILREALWVVIIGVGVGLPIIFGVTRLAESLLFGLTPTDPVTLVLASAALTAVAMVASYLPARRATLVDPLTALRHE